MADEQQSTTLIQYIIRLWTKSKKSATITMKSSGFLMRILWNSMHFDFSIFFDLLNFIISW